MIQQLLLSLNKFEIHVILIGKIAEVNNKMQNHSIGQLKIYRKIINLL